MRTRVSLTKVQSPNPDGKNYGKEVLSYRWSRASDRQIIGTRGGERLCDGSQAQVAFAMKGGPCKLRLRHTHDRYNTKRRLVFAIGIDLRDMPLCAQTTGKYQCGFLRTMFPIGPSVA